MKTAHTPGPWAEDKYGNINDKEGHTIRVKGLALSNGAEACANAILIAAAPDLFSELVAVLEWATTEKAPLRDQEIESIRKVIAKAKGEQRKCKLCEY